MKAKTTVFVRMLVTLMFTSFIGNFTFAQTTSGTASTTNCLNGGIVTANSTGLGATPQYQLLKSGIVVAPVSGDATQFTNVNVFGGLQDGTYTVKGRADAVSSIYTSGSIAVDDGYTSIAVVTPTKVTTCVGGTAVLTSTVTGGKAPFTYKIATQATPGTIIETSASTSAASYNFAALPANNYIVSVTDACGQTVTGATSISNPTVTVADIKVWSSTYLTYEGGVGLCSNPLRMVNEGGWAYNGGALVSAADAALFTWKIKYQGVLYGADSTGDGYADPGGAGIPLANAFYRMPQIATRAGIIADFANMRIVLSDMCGNTKEFLVTNYNAVSSRVSSTANCNGTPIINTFLGAGMACLPLDITFTNASNPADVVMYNITAGTQTFVGTGLTPGQTYNLTYLDAAGFTGNTVYKTTTLAIPVNSSLSASQLAINTNQYYLNGLNYAKAYLIVNPALTTDLITYTVTASNNPLVPVGYSNSQVYGSSAAGINLTKVNASDPTDYWPKGIYTLSVSSPCGVTNATFNINGYTASLSGNTVTPVCGGFNYIMNGTFDVPTAYQVIIVSGPGGVGQVRDLASTTASLPFNGLGYGTYVFGLRIKGGTANVLTQTVTYGASNVITVDHSSTGGYVCSAGASNGTLTIAATTSSPSPGNVLEYALSLDNGATFGAYQSANTFSGLSSGTYFFKVKDGCGNIITQSAQVGVAAAPVVSVNGVPGDATLCAAHEGETVTLTLDVNIPSATYSWALGNGITAANSNIKNPVVSLSDMAVGVNNYVCTITLGAPCNTTSTADVAITILANPNLVVTNPAAICSPNTVNLTLPAVTAGSTSGLTYTYFTDAAATISLSNPTTVATSGTYYIKGTNPGTSCWEIKPVTVIVKNCTCINAPASGTPSSYTKFGISTFKQKQSAWPENIPNGQLALESKDTGMVITRVAHVSSVPAPTDSIADPKEGMIVYDIQDSCVKLFNGTNWKCIEKSCND